MKQILLKLLRLWNIKKVVDDLIKIEEEVMLIDLKDSEIDLPR